MSGDRKKLTNNGPSKESVDKHSIYPLKEYRQCIAAAHRQRRVSNIFQAFGCDIPALHGSEFDLKERVDIAYRAVERTRRQGAVGESPVVLSVRACQDGVRGRSFVSRVVDLADRCHPFRELLAGRYQ